MKEFARALAYAWPYRIRLAGSLVCAVMVALFWGANISAIYPLMTVLLENKTLVAWTDDAISLAEKESQQLEEEIEARQNEWEQTGDAKARAGLASLIARRQDSLLHRRTELALYQRIRPAVAYLSPTDPFQTLCLVMGMVVLGMVVKSFFDFLQEYLSGYVVQAAVFDLRNDFYRKTIGLDLAHFSSTGTHAVTAHFTSDIESLTGGLRALLGKVLLEPLKALSCLVFACWFNWRLTLVTLLLFPAGAMLMGLIGRYLKKLSRRNLESTTRIYKILQETLQGIRVVKAFTMESRERFRFFKETRQNNKEAVRLLRMEAISGPALELMAMTGIALALMAGAYLVLTERTHLWGVRLTYDPVTPGLLMTFYALLAGMSDPLRKAFSVYGRVQRGVAAAERIFACMDREPTIKSPRRAPKLPPHRHSISFEDVSFHYDRRHPVLDKVNLDIRFGETLAIVGLTGCGKSSLINLIPRFYDPTHGTVRIDGYDLRELNRRSVRSQIGLVTQQTILFDDTVFNNIAYGVTGGASRQRVIEAAQAAYAHKFILELPEGYDTEMGEMGTSLSGGQRQRIALARAILRNPSILILDEATSSLDVESESLIHQALLEFKKGRTIVMVTHRLGTLDMADRVAVMDAGRLEAVGSIDSVLQQSATFRRLYDVHAKSA
ncbi:ABC transporter ATP-binding protein/permease [bacterium]|nr:ABC transporter ATP-binding protein/permease [bacterium]